MPPAALRPPGRPRLGAAAGQSSRKAGADNQARWAGAKGGGGVRARGPGEGSCTWDGGGGRGGVRGSGSGGGGGWGWRIRTGGAGNGNLGEARGGRGTWPSDGGGVLGGARGSGSGGGGGWGLEDAYGQREERVARCCSRGEGDVHLGRREWGPGGSWWRLGERERREGAAEARPALWGA